MITAQERINSRWIPAGYTEYARDEDAVIYASPDRLHAIAYRGKSGKPEWYYRFTNPSDLDRRAKLFFEKCAAIRKWSEDKRLARKGFETSLKPGDILVSSWGYDQTNVNFYQIIEITGKCTLILREICGTIEETGHMQGKIIPRPGIWAKDSLLMKKRAGSLGTPGKEYVNISKCQTAFIWDGKPEFCSWYA